MIGGLTLAADASGKFKDIESPLQTISMALSIFNASSEQWQIRQSDVAEFDTPVDELDMLTTGGLKKSKPSRKKARNSLQKHKKSNQKSGIFGSVAIPFSSIATNDKWQRARKSVAADSGWSCNKFGKCDIRKSKTNAILDSASRLSFFNKLSLINQGVNELIEYQPDLDTYGTKDHWALPTESLKMGFGDCEDYVIMKMALLKKLNIPTKAMSLVVLKDTDRNLYHAVLAVSTNQGTFILDNVRSRVLRDRQLPHYLPLYSFSGKRSWVHGWKRSQKQRLSQAKNLTFAQILPGESFASTPLLDDKMSARDYSDLRPTISYEDTKLASAQPWITVAGNPR